MKSRNRKAAMPDPQAAGWAPRRAQEARLAELEAQIARCGKNSIALETERAALLGALNRHQDAQQAFVAILQRAPTDFSALNEFGTLLTRMGPIEAACRVYAEAILHLELARRRVERLPEGADRDHRTLDVALRYAHSLYFLGRFAESVEVLLPHEARLSFEI